MQGSELRSLSDEELGTRERDLRRELFDMRVRHQTAVLDSTASLKKLRKQLARVLTVRGELRNAKKSED